MPQKSAKLLAAQIAREFRRYLWKHEALWESGIPEGWIEKVYRPFCYLQQIENPPRYALFLAALADENMPIMPRRRTDRKVDGRRKKQTYYRLPPPATEVVELAAEHRMRA